MNTLLKTLVLGVSIIGFSSNALAQEGESLPLKKNAISFSIIGATPAIGFVYEGLVSDHLSLELGVGWLSVGAGAKWYPNELQPGKFNFHTGLLFSVSPPRSRTTAIPTLSSDIGLGYFVDDYHYDSSQWQCTSSQQQHDYQQICLAFVSVGAHAHYGTRTNENPNKQFQWLYSELRFWLFVQTRK